MLFILGSSLVIPQQSYLEEMSGWVDGCLDHTLTHMLCIHTRAHACVTAWLLPMVRGEDDGGDDATTAAAAAAADVGGGGGAEDGDEECEF